VRSIILTGGNDGIGFFMTQQLLKDGDRVAVLDIRTERIGALKAQYKDRLIVCESDVSDADAVQRAVSQIESQWGCADIAVHNACICLFTGLENTSNEDYKRVLDVNFYGAVNLTRAVLPSMKRRGNGRICLTSSGVGVMGFINISAYAASKGAIESFAKCMDIEARPFGVTFHLLHPPLTRTTSSKPLPVPPEFMADPQKVGQGLAKNLGKKRFIINHSFAQRVQTRMAYLFTTKLGRLMSRMTAKASDNTASA
jgi:NAD(P)-dependent dehydrogenase (short-subunit alcohol dehydrogenase family)